MAFSTATRTFNIKDYVATRYDVRRTKVYVTTNVENDRIFDTVSGDMRLGTGAVTIAPNGDVSVTVPIPGTTNPASWQTTVHIDYPDAGTRERHHEAIGPFTITSSGLLADLVVQQEIPPTYLSIVTAQLDQYVDDAAAAVALADAQADRAETEADRSEAARDAAEGYRDDAADLILTDLGTTDGQASALLANPNSLTAKKDKALAEAYIAPGTVHKGTKQADLHRDGAVSSFDPIAAFLTYMVGVAAIGLISDSTGANPGLVRRWFYYLAKMVVLHYPDILVRFRDFDYSGTGRWKAPVTLSSNSTLRVRWVHPGTANQSPSYPCSPGMASEDLDVAVEVALASWTPGTLGNIIARGLNADADWQLALNTDGTPRLRWWQPGGAFTTVTGTVPIPSPGAGVPLYVRPQLATDLSKFRPVEIATTNGSPNITTVPGTFRPWDVGLSITGTGIPGSTTILSVATNGASAVMSANATATTPVNTTITSSVGGGTGYAVAFVTSPGGDGATWTQVGATIVVPGAAKPMRYTPGSKIWVGSSNGGGGGALAGDYYEVWLRGSINGPTMAPITVQNWTSELGPNVIHNNLIGGPQLEFLCGAWPGKNITDTLDNAAYMPHMVGDFNTLLQMFNTSHNEAGAVGTGLLKLWDRMLAHFRAAVPNAAFAAITQNPSLLTVANMPSQMIRVTQMRALKNRGVDVIDTARFMYEDGRSWNQLIDTDGEGKHVLDNGEFNPFALPTDTPALNPQVAEMLQVWNALQASASAVRNPADLVRG